ncbi:MAG: hypothetical protein WC961_08085 [Anaerovoracaceae bacterium]
MKLSSFGKLLAPTYTDKLSINRYTAIENADGTIGMEIPEEPLYSDIQCRISFKQNDNPESIKEDSNPIYLQIKIFCSPNQDIQKGDILVANRIGDDGEIIETYNGIANLPFRYVTHQEVLLTKVGDA